MLKSLKDNRFWLFFGLLMIGLRFLISGAPEWVDRWYTHGLYLVIRPVFDYSLGWLPFPAFYLFLLVLTIFVIVTLRRWRRLRRLRARSWGYHLISSVSFLVFLVGIFLLVWGFNYAGKSVEQKMGFQLKKISPDELQKELETQTTLLVRLRDQLSDSINTPRVFAPAMTAEIRERLVRLLQQNGFPYQGYPQLRFLYPKGSLLAISTAGFYWPFVGECHVDPGLHPLQIPHVIAHELSHAYSITDEGSCNFLAWLACSASSDTFVRYAGQLSYWRHLNSSYRRTDPDAYLQFWRTLDGRIKQDLEAIRLHTDQYPEYFTSLRNLFYGSYLKAQGVSDGLASYGRVVNLVMSWKADKEMN